MTNVRQEAPWLEGAFFSGSPATFEQHGSRLWSDTDAIRFGGDWRPEELRTSSHPLGKVAIYGHCLASDTEIKQQCDHALEQDRAESLTNLPGSFTTIVLRPDRLTVFADLANQFPFFYTAEGSQLRYSNLTAPLRGSTMRPDIQTIATRLGLPWSGELLAGRSSIENVQRLEAGHVLDVHASGRKTLSAYETFVQPRLSWSEASEQLRNALQASMRLRTQIGRNLSCDFSGGHDSTSLAYLLAHEMDEPLTITTFYAKDLKTDDLERVRTYLDLPDSAGKFSWHGFESQGANMLYDQLLQTGQTDEADVSIAERGRAERYYEFLHELGSELHITGDGADGIFDLDPREYIGQLAKPPTYAQFLRSVVEAARTTRHSPLEIFRDARLALRLSPAEKLLRISQALRQADSELAPADKAILFGAAVAPEWLASDARKMVGEAALALSSEVRTPVGWDRGNYEAYASIKSLGMSNHGMMQSAAQKGLRVHVPYLDNDVLRACFALPANVRMNPWEFKPLLEDVVRGKVPDVVTQRSTKGVYTQYGYRGMRAAAPIIDALLHNPILADLGVIEPKQVKDSLEKAYRGEAIPWASFDGLIATELWLRDLDGQSASDILGQYSSKGTRPESVAPADLNTEAYSSQAQYGLPPHVVMLVRPTGAIALNLKTGTYHRLNKSAAHIVELFQDSADGNEVLGKLSVLYPTIDQDNLKSGMARGVTKLLGQDILVEGVESFNLIQADETIDTAPMNALVRSELKRADIKPVDYACALGGLVMARALQSVSFARRVASLQRMHKTWCTTTATEAEAQRLFSAVHRVSESYPSRIACLELSVTTALAAALKRKKVNVVIGVKTDPDSFHAWPEVDGIPITRKDEPIVGRYQPIFKI